MNVLQHIVHAIHRIVDLLGSRPEPASSGPSRAVPSRGPEPDAREMKAERTQLWTERPAPLGGDVADAPSLGWPRHLTIKLSIDIDDK